MLWRGFLAGHFGRASADSPDAKQSAAKLLCAFEGHPFWNWARVSSNQESLRNWLCDHRDRIKTLRYGNHRKFESHKPLILYEVISSFLRWVMENGGSPQSALRINTSATPEANFDAMYHSLKGIRRFGRTGAFDLLCLLGNMSILAVQPGSCHLRGSTGPLKGARKLWGPRRPSELSRLADATAKALEIPYDVFEDALCMWQK